MQLLCYLAARRGEVVSRTELFDTVWQDTIVNNEALTRSISALRKALDDDPKAPAFIETIHKRGYRLLDAGSSSVDVRPPARSGPASVGKWLAVAVASLSLIVVATRLFRSVGETPRPGQASQARASAIKPVTAQPGREIDPALAPGGRLVAYAWNGGSGTNFDIYVRRLDSGSAIQVSSHDSTEYAPAWSPDGAWLAYARGAGKRTEIYQVASSGGTERLLVDSAAEWSHGIAWSPDGDQIAFTTRAEASAPHRIAFYDRRTGQVRSLTQPPAHIEGDRYPSFSPDGSRLAFVRVAVAGAGEIFVVSTRGDGEARQLTAEGRPIASVEWAPGGDAVIFASDRSGSYALWRLPLAGGEPSRLLAESGNVGNVSVDPVSGQIVFEQWQEDSNVWRVEAPPAGQQAEAERFIASTREDATPSVSPSGERLAFVSSRSGARELWLCTIDGSGLERLTSFDGPYVSSPNWSPDGTSLAFQLHAEGHWDIHLLDLASNRLSVLTETQGDDLAPSFSADGRFVYFGSRRSGAWEIWKVSVHGGEALQVTEEGGIMAFESHDGRRLYVAKHGVDGLFVRPTAGGPEERVLSVGWGGEWGGWALAAGKLFYVDRGSEPMTTLHRFDLGTGSIEALATVDNVSRFSLTVTPDGTQIFFAQVDAMTTDLAVAVPRDL